MKIVSVFLSEYTGLMTMMITIKQFLEGTMNRLCIMIFSLFLLVGQNLSAQSVVEVSGTIAGGNRNGTIRLIGNTTLSSYINVSGDLTVDLNGYVLYSDVRHFVVDKGNTLTIIDGNPSRQNIVNGHTFYGGVITGARGDRGGAAYVNGTMYFNAGTIAFCSSVRSGNYDNQPMHKATDGCGGGIFLNQDGRLEMDGGNIAYCSTVTVSIDAPSAETDNVSLGGGVFIDAEVGCGAEFIMKSGSIYGCSAGCGGGVYIHAPLDKGFLSDERSLFRMEGGEIYDCISTQNGKTDNLKPFEYWRSFFGGGGVCVRASEYGRSRFELAGGTIRNCKAYCHGPGVYSNGNIRMDGGLITGCCPASWTDEDKADGDFDLDISCHGGGVYVQGISGNMISYFTMTGGKITDCHAASGGGVMIYGNGNFRMEGNMPEISGCGALSTNGSLGNGGAVYIQSSIFDFINGRMTGNRAIRYGGAVNINQSATFNLSGTCIVTDNRANHGGGLSQEAGDCSMTIAHEAIRIENNVAGSSSVAGNGGGIFIEKGILNISAGSISGNSASGSGGGVSLRTERISGDITVNITGGSIVNNTAGRSGGGLDLYANIAVGSTEKNDVNVNVDSGILSGNKATDGGAVNIWVEPNNSVATMNIGKETAPVISSNEVTGNGGGFCLENGSINIYTGDITRNSAGRGGGGCVKNGNVVVKNGSLSYNSASYYGGGLYVYNPDSTTSRTVNFDGGTFEYNTASYGGGICVDGDIRFTAIGTEITHNTACNGGGVYLQNLAWMIFNGGLITGNHARKHDGSIVLETAYGLDISNVHGVGGGVYMNSNTNLDFEIDNVLGFYGNRADSAADDVFSNGDGTMINLPDVSTMSLQGFAVPTTDLFWVEDYVDGDTMYSKGTDMIGESGVSDSVRRYRDALASLRKIYKLSRGTGLDCYLCIALGYEVIFITVEKSGLAKGESSLFTVAPAAGDGADRIMVLLTGDGNGTVSKKVAVYAGTWKVEEQSWSWTYVPEGETSITREIGSEMVENDSEELVFSFVNTKNAAAPPHDESIVVNKM